MVRRTDSECESGNFFCRMRFRNRDVFWIEEPGVAKVSQKQAKLN